MKIEVAKIVFDTETQSPELVLVDGTKRVIELIPTGSCWVEYWVTPEQRDKSVADAKARDLKLQEDARKRNEAENIKKRWWQR